MYFLSPSSPSKISSFSSNALETFLCHFVYSFNKILRTSYIPDTVLSVVNIAVNKINRTLDLSGVSKITSEGNARAKLLQGWEGKQDDGEREQQGPSRELRQPAPLARSH